MILQKYKAKKNMTDEEKQVEKWYTSWCEANGRYDHLTDEELNKRYKKYFLNSR